MRTMPRLTSLAALAALTISSSVAAAGPEPVSLVTRDLDWVTAGSAEALRALTDDSGRVDVGTLPGRTGVVQPDRQVAPVDTPQFGVPGTAVLSSLVSGINGSDGLAGPLGNAAAIGVLLSLGAGVVVQPPVIGTPGGGVPVLEPDSAGGLSGGGPIPMIAVPGIPSGFALDLLRPARSAAIPFVELPLATSRITAPSQ